MRVLVVDDHQIVRQGVRSLLEKAGMDVCGEAVDGSDAIAKTKELKPDAVVMDISMPNLNGIEATIAIARSSPEICVVMLSQHDYPHIVRQAVNAGARAYVVKSAISTELLPALGKTRYTEGPLLPYVFGSAQRNVPVQEILQRGAVLEAELRESEERYRATFERAAVGIAHIAENGQWLRVNQKLCSILGYTEGELLNGRILDIIHPSDLAAELEQAARLARGEVKQYSVEKRYIRKDDRIVWMHSTVAPVYDAKLKLKYFVRVLEDITTRKQMEDALRRSEQELARENADLKLLQNISTQLIREENGKALYEKIVDAAVAIMGSEYASMQLLEPKAGTSGELILLAFRGFNAQAAEFWQRVPADSGSTCAAALRTSKRVIVPDVEECEFMAGTGDLATYRDTAIRAVQSTPLLSRTGQVVGMISTHWRQVHTPTERELRMFDVLARQAADLLERRRSEEAFREIEERLRISTPALKAQARAAAVTESQIVEQKSTRTL
jgi:PAS domain S-box-containing protein